tara:strand:- start:291 stop:611 length:321 start_codon:yes stop_codon:yes gene_type:complete
MLVKVCEKNNFAAVRLVARNSTLFFVRGRRVTHVLALRGRPWWQRRWWRINIFYNSEGAIRCVYLFKVKLKEFWAIGVVRMDREFAHGTSQDVHLGSHVRRIDVLQ